VKLSSASDPCPHANEATPSAPAPPPLCGSAPSALVAQTLCAEAGEEKAIQNSGTAMMPTATAATLLSRKSFETLIMIYSSLETSMDEGAWADKLASKSCLQQGKRIFCVGFRHVSGEKTKARRPTN
jgi:hypothetical protein